MASCDTLEAHEGDIPPNLMLRYDTGLFVRDNEYVVREDPTHHGRVLTTWEFYETYGPKALSRVKRDPLFFPGEARDAGAQRACRRLQSRWKELHLTIEHLTNLTGLPALVLRELLVGSRPQDPRIREHIARVLGMDDRYLSVDPAPDWPVDRLAEEIQDRLNRGLVVQGYSDEDRVSPTKRTKWVRFLQQVWKHVTVTRLRSSRQGRPMNVQTLQVNDLWDPYHGFHAEIWTAAREKQISADTLSEWIRTFPV